MVLEQNETRQLILDAGEKIFSDRCDKALLDAAEQGQFADDLWQVLVANGFHQIGSAGSGSDLGDLFAFLQLCGRFAVPLPMADVLLANSWCGATDDRTGVGHYVEGEVQEASWGRALDRVIGIEQASGQIYVGQQPECLSTGTNLAGEARDTVRAVNYETLTLERDAFAQMALAQVNLIAGSLQTQLELGILFATERTQFGRPISKFQAIQHSLAVIAAEVAAAKLGG